jgi:hypothetical protein
MRQEATSKGNDVTSGDRRVAIGIAKEWPARTVQ